jgi:hypothetical protein
MKTYKARQLSMIPDFQSKQKKAQHYTPTHISPTYNFSSLQHNPPLQLQHFQLQQQQLLLQHQFNQLREQSMAWLPFPFHFRELLSGTVSNLISCQINFPFRRFEA